jgi:hypothetical protein
MVSSGPLSRESLHPEAIRGVSLEAFMNPLG